MAKTFKPLSHTALPLLGKALKKRGFSTVELLSNWPEIVGPQLAPYCQPDKITWPRQKASDRSGHLRLGKLVVAAEGPVALELQHMAPVILERVNTFMGQVCVGQLSIVNRPVAQANAPQSAPKPDPKATIEPSPFKDMTTDIHDPALRDVLVTLGQNMTADKKPS